MLHSIRGRTGWAAALLVALAVAACDDDGNEPEVLPPAAPNNVGAASTGPTSVRVTWDAVTGASNYIVERAQGAASTQFTEIATVATTQYDDQNLQPETDYRYRVSATGSTGRSTPSGISSVRTGEEGPRIRVISQNITASQTWRADTTYVLSGFIQVLNGAIITIEPGTKIVGDFDIPGSSLFITRGAKLMAQGTAQNPIVFTSERPEGQRQPGDWGGVIIIGNGITNRVGDTQIEGTGVGAGNPAQNYGGGTDNDDSSGVLRYVRIEFAGFPTAPNQELNSLTLAAVGRGTVIEYVQVLLGLDDSFEWFGGAVDAKYLVSYEAGDDHFDMSEGYIGRIQYAIAFQSIQPEARPGLSGGVATDPTGLENDGCAANNCSGGSTNQSASQPYTIPVLANFTLVGPRGAWSTPSGEIGMMLRRGTGGLYVNGAVAGYPRAAISYRGQETNTRETQGNLGVHNVLVAQTGPTFQPGDPAASAENRQFTFNLTDNAIEESALNAADLFANISPQAGGQNLDFTPAAGSPLATGGLNDFAALPAALRNAAGTFITPTVYRGAADPAGSNKWWLGWTNWNRF